MKTLTEPEIKALSGWELAAAVQEIVFGDKVSWQKPCSGSERKPYIKNRRNLWELIPAYHSDGNAMLALKEKLAMDGRTVRVETFRQCGSPENIINYVDVMVDTTLNCVKADREPTALCRAALLAYMKKGEV